MYLIWKLDNGLITQYESETLPSSKCVVYYNDTWYVSDNGVLTETTTNTVVGIPTIIYSL